MACESSVALNPWPTVQNPDCRYVPLLLYSWDYNICCCQKRQDHIAFPLPVSFFLSACILWRASRAVAESDVFRYRHVLVRHIKLLPQSTSLFPLSTHRNGQFAFLFQYCSYFIYEDGLKAIG